MNKKGELFRELRSEDTEKVSKKILDFPVNFNPGKARYS
jgi:hypothetical protein